MKSPSIFVVAAMPPPLHGQSKVNACIARDVMSSDGIDCRVCDIGPVTGKGRAIYHLSRLFRVIAAVGGVLNRMRQGCLLRVYSVYEAGYGFLYNILILAVARISGAKIYLHHHSSAHLVRCSFAFIIISIIAGRDAVHVVLSSAMGADLRRHYPRVKDVLVSGNACHVDIPEDLPARSRVEGHELVIGIMSNLTVEKGVVRGINAFRRLVEEGVACRLEIAGPICDSACAEAIRVIRLEYADRVRYWGLVSGPRKDDFLSLVDVFLFGSSYKYEAQPLVVLEFLSRGCPAIVSSQGYTAELVPDADWIVKDIDQFESVVVRLCADWSRNFDKFDRASVKARNGFRQMRSQAVEQYDSLLNRLLR